MTTTTPLTQKDLLTARLSHVRRWLDTVLRRLTPETVGMVARSRYANHRRSACRDHRRRSAPCALSQRGNPPHRSRNRGDCRRRAQAGQSAARLDRSAAKHSGLLEFSHRGRPLRNRDLWRSLVRDALASCHAARAALFEHCRTRVLSRWATHHLPLVQRGGMGAELVPADFQLILSIPNVPSLVSKRYIQGEMT